MAVKFTNNAATTLAAGINSSVTSISVTDGSVFPALTGSDHFYVTFDDTTNREIVKVTARSGNTLTVVRGQDNTTAQAFNSGDKAELRVVAALLEDITTEVTSTLSVDTFTGDGTTTAFTLSQAPSSEDNLIVFIEGAYQNPGDFVLSGTTLTLDEAPAVDRNIIVYHVKGAVSGNNLNQDSFTADGNTAAFTLSIAPIHENNTQVFIDGVYQQKNSYSISGTTLTLDANPSNGATVEVMTFTQTEVNTLPASFVSGLTEVTAVGADHFMIFDATDSALKKSLVSDVLESATSISTSADATAITIDSSENVTFTNNVTINSGQLTAGGLAYPTSDGTNGQVLTTDGAGTLSFADSAGGVDGIVSNADATAITIDSAEKIGMPTVASTNPVAASAPKLGINGVNAEDAQLMIHRHRANSLGPYVVLAKSRSDTNDKTVIQNGDTLGTISFQGADGSIFQQAAQIQAQVDGTPGSADMPGRIVFLTTPDGSGTPTEKLRILSGGGITFNGDTAAANALDDYEEGTHTATITPTGGSITVNSSVDELGYVKIGRQVTVTGMLTVGSVSSPTGYFNISLPFSIGSWASTYGNRCSGSLWVNPKTGGGNIADYIVYGIQGESQFRVYLGDATGLQADSAQTLYATVDIILSITYLTN